MHHESDDSTSKVLWFVAGVAVGSTIALLFAPTSGRVARRRIGRVAERGRESLTETGQEIVDKGKDLYEKGRKLADEAAEMFDRGKKLVEG